MKRTMLILCALWCVPALATVNTIATPEVYDGDGADTTFDFGWDINTTADLVVTVLDADGVPAVQTLNINYTVSATNNDYRTTPGGTVTFTTAPADGTTIILSRELSPTQDKSSSVLSRSVNVLAALDKLTMGWQDLKTELKLCLRLGIGDYGHDANIPAGPGYVYVNEDRDLTLSTPSAVDANITSAWQAILESAASGSQKIQGKEDIGADHYVDVRDYGAIAGDGIDDSNAFEQARDAAGNGGVILVPVGNWSFGSAIDPGDYRTWWGMGLGSVLNCLAANTDNAVFKESTNGVGYTDFVRLKLTSANTSATALDVDGAHYINHCTFISVFISAGFYRGIDGMLGGCLFVDCDFGTDGSPGAYWQPIRSLGSYQALKNTWINCQFYYATGSAGALALEYSHTQTFLSCIWEQNDDPSIDANGVSELVLDNCSFEVEEPGGANNCLINLGYITTKDGVAIGQGCHARISNSRFTNGASATTPWDAIVYAGGSGCWASFSQISGGLATSYLCKDSGGNYDTSEVLSSRGLRHADNIQVTGMADSNITNTTIYDRTTQRIIQSADPAVLLWPLTATDTRWWIGVTEDAGGDDDDYLEIGTGVTKGSNVKLRLNSTGDTMIPVCTAVVDVNNAEIKDLADTAITLVAAPGAGKWLEFCGASLWLDYSGGALAEPSSPDDLIIAYVNESGAAASAAIVASGFMTATADTAAFAVPVAIAGTAAANLVNKAIVLANTGGDYTGAGSTSEIRVIVHYRVHDGLGL